MSAQRCLATLALLSSIAAARGPEPWTLARSSHFEVYSDAGANSAPALVAAFERMYAFFERQVGAAPDAHRPARIICFGTAQEYQAYRLGASADAYYVGTEGRDYIVMPAFVPGDFHFAAHEYAHLLIRSSGLSLPRWIAEGVAEVASTVQIRERSSSVGGDLPARSRLLRARNWVALSDLFRFGERDVAGQSVFYAQSWALTAMLMLSPEYAPRWGLLVGSLASGVGGEAALRAVYNRSPDAVVRDLHAWLDRIPPPVPLPGIGGLVLPAQPVTVSSSASRAMLADLRLALGDLAGAEAMYRALTVESGSAEVYAGLGLVALRRGNTPAALDAWERAMQLGIADPGVCYRYAMLADTQGLGADRVRSALQRAIALAPDFDDAHFRLALMDKNAGQPESAIAHLKAMRNVTAARAFPVWSVRAEALLELGRRDDARAAALKARESATSETEREHAAQILYMADTDMAVQLTSGPDGPHFQTIRVPHGQPPRNPFIESGDGIQRMEATLKQIECGEDGIRIALSGQSGDLTLSVPDPSRVEIRNTPGVSFEFTCGPQTPRRVVVEFTAGKVLRGLEMH
jgi:tetratricopeptide (TPR) repeat protein